MAKAWTILACATALCGCGETRHAVRAEVSVAPDSGVLTLTCRQSTSGRCHGLVAGAIVARGVADVGSSVTIEGVVPGARVCVSDVSPEPGKCGLREIAVGTTIISHEKLGRS